MRIVEKDFIMTPCSYGLFDLTFIKKIKKEDSNEFELKEVKAGYGLTLATCIRRIISRRFKTAYEGESPYLLEALKKIISLEEELVKLCKESLPEKFDNGE